MLEVFNKNEEKHKTTNACLVCGGEVGVSKRLLDNLCRRHREKFKIHDNVYLKA